MRILRRSQAQIWPHRRGYHVLTFAEEGFAPLSIHGEALGITKSALVAFANAINQRNEVGSLYPTAPISAVPRSVIRDEHTAGGLVGCILEFLRANANQVRATKLICDFRTPHVPSFVGSAIEEAFANGSASEIEEVVLIDDAVP